MNESTPECEAPRHRSRLWGTFKAVIRARVTAGLITILPIIVTFWLVRVVFGWMRDASQWVVLAILESTTFQKYVWTYIFKVEAPRGEKVEIQQFLAAHPALDWGIAIASVLLTIAILYVVGVFAANVIGRRIIDWLEQLVVRVPFVKTIYGALKQILGLFSAEQTKGFQRVALVPFPNEITRSVGFITNTFKDAVTGEELCSVFIATTPNPTTGFVFVLRRSDIIEVDWSVEEAVKAIISGGILTPGSVTMGQVGQRSVVLPPAVNSMR